MSSSLPSTWIPAAGPVGDPGRGRLRPGDLGEGLGHARGSSARSATRRTTSRAPGGTRRLAKLPPRRSRMAEGGVPPPAVPEGSRGPRRATAGQRLKAARSRKRASGRVHPSRGTGRRARSRQRPDPRRKRRAGRDEASVLPSRKASSPPGRSPRRRCGLHRVPRFPLDARTLGAEAHELGEPRGPERLQRAEQEQGLEQVRLALAVRAHEDRGAAEGSSLASRTFPEIAKSRGRGAARFRGGRPSGTAASSDPHGHDDRGEVLAGLAGLAAPRRARGRPPARGERRRRGGR